MDESALSQNGFAFEGKMNAILALTESGVPLIFTPLYVTVYDATRDYWPSAFLALGIVLLLPALPVFM